MRPSHRAQVDTNCSSRVIKQQSFESRCVRELGSLRWGAGAGGPAETPRLAHFDGRAGLRRSLEPLEARAPPPPPPLDDASLEHLLALLSNLAEGALRSARSWAESLVSPPCGDLAFFSKPVGLQAAHGWTDAWHARALRRAARRLGCTTMELGFLQRCESSRGPRGSRSGSRRARTSAARAVAGLLAPTPPGCQSSRRLASTLAATRLRRRWDASWRCCAAPGGRGHSLRPQRHERRKPRRRLYEPVLPPREAGRHALRAGRARAPLPSLRRQPAGPHASDLRGRRALHGGQQGGRRGRRGWPARRDRRLAR